MHFKLYSWPAIYRYFYKSLFIVSTLLTILLIYCINASAIDTILYDQQHRLISLHFQEAGTIDFGYDAVGNRLSLQSSGTMLQKPSVSDMGSFTFDKTQLLANTTIYPKKFGDLTYECKIGTVLGGSDLLDWSIFQPSSDGLFIMQPLSLSSNQNYFLSVRVKNFAGEVVTDIGTSDGITVLNPTDDNDNDGASNLQEQNAGTNPFNSDSDNDRIPDGWEIQYQLNPLADDALSDKDGDRFSNLREFVSQSSPNEIHDVPACIADFDKDGDIDGHDLSILIREYNRQNCSEANPCQSDIYADGKVDKTDLIFFIEDFGRNDCEFFGE